MAEIKTLRLEIYDFDNRAKLALQFLEEEWDNELSYNQKPF